MSPNDIIFIINCRFIKLIQKYYPTHIPTFFDSSTHISGIFFLVTFSYISISFFLLSTSALLVTYPMKQLWTGHWSQHQSTSRAPDILIFLCFMAPVVSVLCQWTCQNTQTHIILWPKPWCRVTSTEFQKDNTSTPSVSHSSVRSWNSVTLTIIQSSWSNREGPSACAVYTTVFNLADNKSTALCPIHWPKITEDEPPALYSLWLQ